MNDKSEYPDSYYLHSANNIVSRDQLTESIVADVCVIGGGYTGLLTALNLAEKNYKVVLLEAHKIGWGASGRNGGQVGSGHNKKIADLEHDYGKALATDLAVIIHALCVTYGVDLGDFESTDPVGIVGGFL